MSMSTSYTHAAAPAAPLPGKRRHTPRMIAAGAELRTQTAWEPATRGQAISALKRAAPALGFPDSVVNFVDYLAGCTKAQDWQEGARPIAFPTNATLQVDRQLGRSRIKALIRAAAEWGLMQPKDSSTGHRYGRRENGELVEAYGFDLTPLLARRAEFEAAAAAHRERHREGRRLRARITATRYEVLVLAEAALTQGLAGGDWPALADAARRLAELRGDSYDPAHLDPIAARLTSLRDLVHGLVCDAVAPVHAPAVPGDVSESAPDSRSVEHVESGPQGSQKWPLYTPTTHLESPRDTVAPVGPTVGPDRPQAHRDGGSRSRPIPRATAGQGDTMKGESALRGYVMTPDHVLRIAPAFRDWLTTSRPGWNELMDAARSVGDELGVSRHAWGQACVVLGRVEAVTAVAVISARHAAGKIRSPGGYLRGMVERHRAGKLLLDRTMFGLADGLDHGRTPGQFRDGSGTAPGRLRDSQSPYTPLHPC